MGKTWQPLVKHYRSEGQRNKKAPHINVIVHIIVGKKKEREKKRILQLEKAFGLFSRKKPGVCTDKSLQGNSLQGTDEPVDRREIDGVNSEVEEPWENFHG